MHLVAHVASIIVVLIQVHIIAIALSEPGPSCILLSTSCCRVYLGIMTDEA